MALERPESGPFPASFRLGEWLVEPSLDRVSRNGTAVRLRPQLTDLLVFLARHAGRTVAKEEILASVWSGQYVAESGMTRCIAEIRQALEDDARVPKLIQTVPKRGYRLVAPVVFLAPDAAPAARAPAITDGADCTEDQAARHVGEADRLHSEAEHWGDEGDRGVERMGRQAAARTSRVAASPTARVAACVRRQAGAVSRWPLAIGLGALAVLALAWTTGGWSRPPALGERDTVLLADFVNTTGDAAFDQTLRLALAVQLGQAPFLNILPAGRARSALILMGRSADQPVVGPVALEVCRRESAALLLQGSIARFGSRYAIGLEAIACASGDSVVRALQDVESKDRVLAALGTLGVRLRQKLGESRSSLQRYDVPIVRATTPSLDALKALSLGDLNRDRGLLDDALGFYRRATDLDPQFAVAWARRGAVAYNLGQCVTEQRFGPADEPTVAFTKAYELRDRVSEPERLYILGHYQRLVEGDPLKAVETYKIWKRLYPGSVVPPTNLASIYSGTLGQYDTALAEAREAVRLAPYSSIARRILIVAYLGTGREADARSELRDIVRRGNADILSRELALQLALSDGDDAGIQEQARWAAGDARAATLFTQYRALAAASLGRLGESRRLWLEAASAAAQAGPAQRAMLKVLEAETEALLGDPRVARAAAAEALALDRHPDTLLTAAIPYSLSGDAARAERLVEEACARTDAGICSRYAWGPVARALVDARAGRPEQALRTLQPAAPFERARDFALAPLCLRANLELAAGRTGEAAATYREVLRLAPVAPASPWVAYARLGLARAERASGDATASRAAYDGLISVMKQADPNAPLLLAANRERASLSR